MASCALHSGKGSNVLRTIRLVVTAVAGVLAFAAVADLREPPVSEPQRAAFAEACTYYQKRAQIRPDRGAGDFVAFLSEACATAEDLLEAGTPEQRARSALLLSRIALLRRTIARMNAERAAGAAADPAGAAGYLPVSPSGEFLIAHRLGVLLVFDVWLDTGVPFSIASYP